MGKNNAGKSTLIEALRLISLFTERYRTVSYTTVPEELDSLYKYTRGIRPSLLYQNFNFKTVTYLYGPYPAIVRGNFSNGSTVEVFIGEDDLVFGVIRDRNGRVITSKGEANRLDLPRVAVLPQLGPLHEVEEVLGDERVRRFEGSALSSQHFRNQLRIFYDDFETFKQMAESTWTSLLIRDIQAVGEFPELSLQLILRNDEFVGDVAAMGHGLQMWLQTIWFLARSREAETVILDEPDVYMHADLQRKLIRLLRDRFQQTVVATHSVEIMSEVEPENILILDKGKEQARFATDIPEVQSLIQSIGGVHNLDLARLLISRKCLFVEGEDLEILKQLHRTVFPQSEAPIDAVAKVSIGGWGGWQYVVGSRLWLKETMKDLAIYCVLDSDYFDEAQKRKRLEEAMERNIRLKIWDRKEVENYLLVPGAIVRVLQQRNPPADAIRPTAEGIANQIELIADAMRNDTTSAIAEQIKESDRRLSTKTTFDLAIQRVERAWESTEGKLSVVSGKAVLSKLNEWLQQNFGMSFTNRKLASELTLQEIGAEMRAFLEAFENNESL